MIELIIGLLKLELMHQNEIHFHNKLGAADIAEGILGKLILK